MSVVERLGQSAGRRFARLTTDAVIRRPALWRLLRGPLRAQFQRLGPRWDTALGPDHLAAYEAALARVAPPPRRALDLGTGTGAGAYAIARRFPEAEIVGLDLAPAMVAQARRKMQPELERRLSFETGDAASLPYRDGSFDLVAHMNMIPFFDELTRVLAPGGWALFAFSGGSETPIWVPPDRLQVELEHRGFAEFAEIPAGRGLALLARKRTSD